MHKETLSPKHLGKIILAMSYQYDDLLIKNKENPDDLRKEYSARLDEYKVKCGKSYKRDSKYVPYLPVDYTAFDTTISFNLQEKIDNKLMEKLNIDDVSATIFYDMLDARFPAWCICCPETIQKSYLYFYIDQDKVKYGTFIISISNTCYYVSENKISVYEFVMSDQTLFSIINEDIIFVSYLLDNYDVGMIVKSL